MKDYLSLLTAGTDLSCSQSYAVMQNFLEYPYEQQCAFLALLSAKKESMEELFGLQQALQEHTQPLHTRFDVVDMVGTGGDGIGSFNISTAASLLIASSGAYVAKHGGRSASSLSGSSDVLTELGIQTVQNQQQLNLELSQHHFSFILAPVFNPIFKQFATLRKSLQMPTAFNILGPLLNPLRPRRQVIGVYRSDLVAKIALILRELGSIHALVVHAEDGLDEFSVSSATQVAELKNGIIREYQITPQEVGLKLAPLESILGGTPAENAVIISELLTNQRQGPMLDILLFNAAAGLYVAGIAATIAEGITIARRLITTQKAGNLLASLQRSHSCQNS